MGEYQDPWNIGTHYPTLKEHAAGYVDMEPHVDTLVRLASECSVIIELGVRSGVSTWAFLTGLPERGMLFAVDSDTRIMSENWLPPQVMQDDRFMYHEGSDLDASTITWLPPKADLIFIDTSHEFEHTVAELVVAAGLLAYRIVLHDYELAPVRDAVSDFLNYHNEYEIELIEKSQWGLVVLKRK